MSSDKSELRKIREFQKGKSGPLYWIRLAGENMATVICIMIPMLLVALIWTDTQLPELGWGLASEALLTVVLFMWAEDATTRSGATVGVIDEKYLESRSRYREARAAGKERGIFQLDVFCLWQIDVELETARRNMCRALKLKWRDYKKIYADMDMDALEREHGKILAGKVRTVNSLEPIELTADMLLYETGGNRFKRGGIPIGAEEYVDKETRGFKHIVISSLTTAFTVALNFVFSGEASWALIVYTIVKLIALFWRMMKGYEKGVNAYVKVGVMHLDAKSEYWDKYVEYIETQAYLEIEKIYAEDDLPGNCVGRNTWGEYIRNTREKMAERLGRRAEEEKAAEEIVEAAS